MNSVIVEAFLWNDGVWRNVICKECENSALQARLRLLQYAYEIRN